MVDWHLQREDCVNQQMFLSFIRDFLSSKGQIPRKIMVICTSCLQCITDCLIITIFKIWPKFEVQNGQYSQ